MRRMWRAVFFLGLVLSTSLPLAQSRVGPAQQRPWRVPLTVDGQPDLQGVWVNNTITPFERPQELADKEFLTDDELTVLK